MDLRQSLTWGRYLQKIGWQTTEIDGAQVFIRKIPLFPWPIGKIQRPDHLPDLGRLDKLISEQKCCRFYLEPLNQKQVQKLENTGWKTTKELFLPAKTLVLNLGQPLEKIQAQMHKDARQATRKKPAGEKIRRIEEKEWGNFYQSWKKIAGWKRLIPTKKVMDDLKIVFGSDALFLAAWKERKIIGGTVVLTAGKKAFYFYAFTGEEGRKLGSQYRVVWEAIKLAKEKGCREFDFEGIFDSRFPIKSWRGFSHFKKSFGGEEKTYPGCFVKKPWGI